MRPITDKQKKLLEKAFTKLDFVDCKAAEYAGVSIATAQKYRVNVFNLYPNGQFSAEQKKLILKAHKLKYSICKAAEYAGVSQRVVFYYWKKNDLNPQSNNKNISQKKVDKILEGHKLEYSLLKTAEYAGVSQGTVYTYWKKNGLKAYGKNNEERKTSQEKLDKILEAHKLRYSTSQTADYAGVGRSVAWKYLKQEGLKPHGRKSIETEISDKSSEQGLEMIVK
jgi:hypothetical protein